MNTLTYGSQLAYRGKLMKMHAAMASLFKVVNECRKNYGAYPHSTIIHEANELRNKIASFLVSTGAFVAFSTVKHRSNMTAEQIALLMKSWDEFNAAFPDQYKSVMDKFKKVSGQ